MFTSDYNEICKRVADNGINFAEFFMANYYLLDKAAEQLGHKGGAYINKMGEALECEGGEVDDELNELHAELANEWVNEMIAEPDNIELTKTNHMGDTISCTIAGKPYDVTGEFYIDREGFAHHTFILPLSGREVEVKVRYRED